MLNPSDITIIIPIFNLQENRLKSFYCVLESISKTNIPVIVYEQVKDESKKIDLSGYGQNISYINVVVESNLVQKSKLINLAVSKCSTKYIWQLDADVLLKWEDILKDIDGEDLIRPFEKVIRLTEEETEKYYQDKTITIKKDDERVAINSFGPISFIVKKDVFLYENGMCEKYEGWGFEDLDFARKMKSKYKLHIVKNSYGIHLWHKYNETKQKESEKNRKIFLENGLEVVPAQYIPHFQNKNIDGSSAKFIHILSYYFIKTQDDTRQFIANTSIEKNLPKGSILINITNEKRNNLNNCININCEEDKPFIDDILKVAFSYCDNEDDIIVFTNSDCIIDEYFYENIKSNINDICFLYRRNISTNYNQNLETLYLMDHDLINNRIDGLAISRKQYYEYRNHIPHIKIAESHWDTGINKAFLNYKVPFKNLFGSLYHIEHDRHWELNDKCYNLNYINENLGGVEKINNENKLPPQISIICCSYLSSYNKKVIDSQKLFLKNIRYQIIPHELIFVEIGFNGKYYFDNVVDIGAEVGNEYKHIKIDGDERMKNIFHKESLFNIGAKHAKTNIFMFCDADVISKNINWGGLVYNTLFNTDNIILQAFNTGVDTEDQNLKFVSRVSRLVDKNYIFNVSNPGICWAMNSKTFNEIKGFNNRFILGDGDTCFLEENVEHRYLPPEDMSSNWKYFISLRNNKRNINPKKQIKYLKDINLIHINHGGFNDRKYKERNYIIYYIHEILKKNYLDYFELGDINKWKNIENELLWLIKEKLNLPEDENTAMNFLEENIKKNIERLCEGGTKIIDIPQNSMLKIYNNYYGTNLKEKVKNKTIIQNIGNMKYIPFDADNNNNYAETNIIIDDNYKDLSCFNRMFINYKGNEKDCIFYKFVGTRCETIEKILYNGFNDISDIKGNFKYLRIRFKDKILISKLFLIRGINNG